MSAAALVREATRALSQDDLDGFAAVSGDDNPIHVDAAYAATTPFRVPVAHGMFLYALVDAELQRLLPGAVTRHLELVFPEPTPVGAEVAVRVEVTPDGDGTHRVEARVTHDGHVGLRATGEVGPTRAPAPPPPAAAAEDTDGDDWWGRALGRSAHVQDTVSADDVTALHALAGGPEPTGTVPAPLLAGLVSRLLGVDLPGRGTNYLRQRLWLPDPVEVDTTLTATVQVTRVRPDRRLVDLATRCRTTDGRVALAGEALVLARGVAAREQG